MLLLDQSRISRSAERKTAAGVTLDAEGKALVAAYESGDLVVQPSTGVANEVFAGVSLSSEFSLASLPRVQDLVVSADPYTVTLDRDPTGATLRVSIGATAITEGDPGAEAAQYSISGRVLTFHSSRAAATATIAYRYSPTVQEAQSIQGDIEPGSHITSALGLTGTIEGGEVYTTEFDTNADWSGVPVVRLGANGRFTVGGSGTIVPCLVTHKPVAGKAYLGISYQL